MNPVFRLLLIAVVGLSVLTGAVLVVSGEDGVSSPALIAGGELAASEDDDSVKGSLSERAAKIALGDNANAVLSLDLISDGGAGNRRDDGVTTGAVSGRGTKIAIEVFATGVRTTLVGVRIRFDFDASLVSFVKAENSAFALSLPDGSVGAALAATSPASLASSGFLARAEFETVADVTGREFSIGIESVTVAESPASSDVLRTSSEISFNAAPSADFDGDGTVGFSDFLTFAGAFGSIRGDSRYEAQFDLDGDGSVAFSDFLIFAGAFGSVVPRPGGDGTTPPAPGAWKMYWTDSGTRKIRRSNLDGSGVEDVVTGLENPVGIALDVSGGKMYYWTASDGFRGKIQRSNLDGSGVEDLVTGLLPTFGIALDVSRGKIYWTFLGRIQRSDLDGSGVEDVVRGLNSPWGIALDVSDGKMYWTDSSIFSRKIRRSNLDGSGVEDLVTTGLESASGIALDVSGGRMYWTDTGTEKIQRSNLDGSVVEDLATGIVGLYGIALESRVPEVDGTDLVIQTSVSDDALTPRQSFTLRATVRNQGDAPAAATTLRYYRSDDATVSTNDTEVGTDAVSALSAGATSAESISLDAPSSAGTYYYGACVDGVSGESNTDNNCSSGVEVTVSGGGGGSGGACRAGLVVNPGETCTYKGNTFSVSSSGRGSIAFFSAGTGIDARGATINGVRWNFHATKNSGSNSWTIHVAD